MESHKITDPKQKRSIEKRNKIIQSGLETIIAHGYHHTTTDDIARAAGVSVGIVYRYFPDKKAILMEGLNSYFEQMKDGFFSESKNLEESDFSDFLKTTLDYFLQLHRGHTALHEELEAMRRLDPDVKELYQRFSKDILEQVLASLPPELSAMEHIKEKILLTIQLMEGYCHFVICTNTSEIDFDYMEKKILCSIEDICKA